MWACSVYIVNTTGAFQFFWLFFAFPPLPSSTHLLSSLLFPHPCMPLIAFVITWYFLYSVWNFHFERQFYWHIRTEWTECCTVHIKFTVWFCCCCCFSLLCVCLFVCHLWMWCKFFVCLLFQTNKRIIRNFGFLVSFHSDLHIFSRLQKQTMHLCIGLYNMNVIFCNKMILDGFVVCAILIRSVIQMLFQFE